MKANHTTDLSVSCAAFVTTFFTYTGIIALAINHAWAEYAHYLLSIILVVMAYLIADINTYPTTKNYLLSAPSSMFIAIIVQPAMYALFSHDFSTDLAMLTMATSFVSLCMTLAMTLDTHSRSKKLARN